MVKHLQDCDCNDWKKYVHQIDNYIEVAVKHGSAAYRGSQFKYCPWCGKKRELKTDKP